MWVFKPSPGCKDMHYLANTSLSGNCTPGSRPYSDLVDDWADSICTQQLKLESFSNAACMYNSMRLAYASFQLMHVTRWPWCLSKSSEPCRKKFLQHSLLHHQGEFWHVSTSVWWQLWQCNQNYPSGPFLRAILPTNGKSRVLKQLTEDKSAHNSTTKVSFSTKNHMFWSAHESSQ